MRRNTKTLVLIAMLATISTVLRLLELPVPFAPPGTLHWDLSDLPVVLGGFALGPWAAVGIAYVKNFIALFTTTTLGAGELANFVFAVSLAVPAAIWFRKRPDTRGAAYGLALGVFCMIVSAMLVNYFIMVPFFAWLIGIPLDAVVGMFAAVNPLAETRMEVVVWTFMPFNLIKGALTGVLSFMLYRRINPVLRQFTSDVP